MLSSEEHQRRLPFDGLLAEVIRDAVEATRIECRASVLAAGDAITLTDGRSVENSAGDRLWSFEVDKDLAPLPETPGTLVAHDRDPCPARILAVGDGNLLLGVHEELGESVPSAVLSLTAGFVYEALEQRLEHLMLDGEADATLVDALLNPDPDEEVDGIIPFEDLGPDGEQQAAASNAIAAGLRFTWGPPGTGKTRVLALAVAEAAERGDRVLVLAHANAAVDEAMKRIAEALDDDLLDGGHVLRVGTPHVPVLEEHQAILPEHHLAARLPELVDRRSRLRAERRLASDLIRSAGGTDNTRVAAELREVRSELRAIETTMKDETASLVNDAQVIGTTLAKLVVDQQLWAWDADVVIVDEASMVGLPFALALAARRPRTLSFFGDFRQLPPIAIGDSEAAARWFGRDVFEAAGVVAAYDEGREDRRVQMLRTQFRMGEQTCETINTFAYGGLLATHPDARDRAIALAERWPATGSEVVVMDTTRLGGQCVIEASPDSFSRFNVSSAVLAATVAEAVADDTRIHVGIISPYRAQVMLMAAATRHHPRVTAATIHRFQGSERDVIILDLTDGPPQDRPSRLTGGDANLALRLLNVAASRAKGKLIVLADMGWIERAHPLGSVGRRLLQAADSAGAETLDAVDVLVGAPATPDESGTDPVVSWFPSWADAVPDLMLHLAATPAASVDVNLPDGEFAGRWVSDLLDMTDERKGHKVLRAPRHVAEMATAHDLDVRLFSPSSQPWAMVGEDNLWIGGTAVDHPAARITGHHVVATYRRLANLTW